MVTKLKHHDSTSRTAVIIRESAIVAASSGEDRPHARPWELVDIDIDEGVHKALQRATGQPGLALDGALRLLVDHALNQAMDLLLAVRATTPEKVGRVAELMTEIAEQLGVLSGWETEQGSSPGG